MFCLLCKEFNCKNQECINFKKLLKNTNKKDIKFLIKNYFLYK